MNDGRIRLRVRLGPEVGIVVEVDELAGSGIVGC